MTKKRVRAVYFTRRSRAVQRGAEVTLRQQLEALDAPMRKALGTLTLRTGSYEDALEAASECLLDRRRNLAEAIAANLGVLLLYQKGDNLRLPESVAKHIMGLLTGSFYHLTESMVLASIIEEYMDAVSDENDTDYDEEDEDA